MEHQKFINFIKQQFKDKAQDVLNLLKYRYNEKGRFYHNLEHIYEVIDYMNKIKWEVSDFEMLAAIFHDIVKDDEKASVHVMKTVCYGFIEQSIINLAQELILKTRDHSIDTILNKADIYSMLQGDIIKMIENEYKLFKEYQKYDFKDYINNRIKFLNNFRDFPYKEELKRYIISTKRNIALFPGSFNPFHVGHLNILEQAEKVFDKVIIAYGNNPEKDDAKIVVPDELFHRQVITYDGLLTNLIDSLDYEVTIIRGIRNYTDLQYELNQLKYLKDMKPDIKIVSFFCDPEYDYISSTAIRILRGLKGQSVEEKYIVK